MANETVAIKAEDISSPPPQDASAPSFAGRLDISSFHFQAPTTPVRRSPRRLPPSTPSTPSLSALKLELPHSNPDPRSASPKRKLRTSSSTSSAPAKRIRSPAKYAHPSLYAHLPPLPDIISPHLIALFIGLNPGLQTASRGHAYAHPSNRFYPLLHSSGLTPVRLQAVDDVRILEWGLGNTNIVERPTRNGAELSRDEMVESVERTEAKVRRFRPECVVIVGKSIWEAVWKAWTGKPLLKTQFRYGFQERRMGAVPAVKKEDGTEEPGWEGAEIFVATSTSGLAAFPPYAEKERIWKEIGGWVEKRRVERAEEGEKIDLTGERVIVKAEPLESSLAVESKAAKTDETVVAVSEGGASMDGVIAESKTIKVESIVDHPFTG